MPCVHFRLSTPVEETPRDIQVRGLFDIPDPETPGEAQGPARTATLPVGRGDPGFRPWSIGLITGPSGCGKSTLAREAFKDALWLHDLPPWTHARSILDGFPESLSIQDITLLLSSVGFSSPPSWLQPYRTLSTGQQFRADLARLLAHTRPGRPAIFDEFTSVVDRTVARIGSAALARTVRAKGLQFIAVTCHEDVIEWLQPDWIYTPADDTFAWRSLRRRPDVRIEVLRCRPSAWPLFAPHHYLSHDIVPMAHCWLATTEGKPCAFSSWIPFFGAGPKARREHRTVVLPDYQGVGVGMALSNLIASMWRGLGYKAMSTTTHPSFVKSRQRSDHWVMTRAPGLSPDAVDPKMKHATTRMTAGFQYTGPAMERKLAQALLGD